MNQAAANVLNERTLVLIKPDAVMRGLVGEILSRFERCGLKITGMKLVRATRKRLDAHFPQGEQWLMEMGEKSLSTFKEYGIEPMLVMGTNDAREIGARIKEWNYEYLLSGPIVAVVVQGVHAIDMVRKLIGHTLPYRAAPGTIRGDFSINSPALANLVGASCKNVIHASANREEAETEISCWFTGEEIVEWNRVDEALMFLPCRS